MPFNAGQSINHFPQGFFTVDMGMGMVMTGRRMGSGLDAHSFIQSGQSWQYIHVDFAVLPIDSIDSDGAALLSGIVPG
jgi:hypothetical protein